MKRFDLIKEELYDVLSNHCGVIKDTNLLCFCHEIDCKDCLFYHECLELGLSGSHLSALFHFWLRSVELAQKDDIRTYCIDALAVDTRWDNEITHCSKILCKDCLFNDRINGCTSLKEKWLDEEIEE